MKGGYGWPVDVAQSPAHKLGQIIGDHIEAAIGGPLRKIAEEFGLYLDHRHARQARQGKRKVAWEDSYGNTHDLDYVLEEDGNEEEVGHPRAFIEIAWRRYTKHSRNKAQEIQGAVLPLAETYQKCGPFLGAVLAGDFTEASRDQLRSHGFRVAYASYDMIVRAFLSIGLDVSFDESTRTTDLRRIVKSYGRLSTSARKRISAEIGVICKEEFDPFFSALRECLGRRITRIVVLALSGTTFQFQTVEEAIGFIEEHDESTPPSKFDHYELDVRYSNGRELRGRFPDKKDCVDYLQSLYGR